MIGSSQTPNGPIDLVLTDLKKFLYCENCHISTFESFINY